MPTIAEQLAQAESDRQDLITNLTIQGIRDLTGNETITQLVPRVLDIGGGGETYTFVEYIESSGNAYINTGYKHQANTRVIADCYANSSNSNAATIFGARADGGTKANCMMAVVRMFANKFGYMRGGQENYSFSTLYNERITVEAYQNVLSYTNGTNTYSITLSNATNDSGIAPMLLFNSNVSAVADEVAVDGACWFLGKMYGCKIYSGDTLERDFRPAVRDSDNEVGLLDIVNNVFYTNQGTNGFTAGDPIQYLILDKIYADGGQHVDFVDTTPDNAKLEIKLEMPQYNNDNHLFGSDFTGNHNDGSQYFSMTTYSNKFYWGNNGSESNGGSWTSDPVTIIYNDTSNHEVKVNGTTIGSGSDISTEGYFYLFKRAGNGDNNKYIGYFYYCKMWDRTYGDLLLDLVPAKRLEDNVIGIYDKVSDTFFENDGSGSFTVE